MKIYDVLVRRVLWQEQVVQVRADDENEAADLAVEQVSEDDWQDKGDDVQPVSAEEV